MPDRFRTFVLNPADTAANTLFTVPNADVAATPPVPVTTFMVKTIVLHNDSGSGTLNAVLTYNNGSTDFEINNVSVAHQATKIINGTFVFEGGDSLKVTSSDANDLVIKVSVLEMKDQQ
tara:strand:+ start:895 stop:1251 length:357 start_codon:yes stop_codon:yes gene_type:complete